MEEAQNIKAYWNKAKMPAIPKLVTNLLLLVQFKMKSRFYKS
jgi:hypothetical protein